ncbi:hypothetical protein [Roseococcus pinisoli]|uniref:Uncharacterized protein n=1 Tax=Roseococcus pinisoli TaxID=2835040 RepID=A0ABS5Q7L4_9PROT|nr:hypothetical protein [Roseococcus pinisoli]MBS7809659.1 hypothetical protein [Roseococcus pinisoli]
MKRLILAACLTLGLAPVLAAPASAQRAGTYNVTGANPDGTQYTGSLELEQIGLLSFRLTWTIGSETIEGVGMVSGLTFATAFSLGGQPSMGIYEIKPDGEMAGQWTIMGAFGSGTEVIRPQ